MEFGNTSQGFYMKPRRSANGIVYSCLIANLLFTAHAMAQGQPSEEREKIRLGLVTNNPSDYWLIFHAGLIRAEEEFGDIEISFEMPGSGAVEDQQRVIDRLLAMGVRAIGVSPNDPINQRRFMDAVGDRVPLIYFDVDDKEVDRRAFIGTDDLQAGREAGELIKQTLPDGGTAVLFVGREDAINAQRRIGGIREALEGTGIQIAVRTDHASLPRAKQNVLDTLTNARGPICLAGIWSYNGPAILRALEEEGLLGEVPVVCFDEEESVLVGIANGHAIGTIVQQPDLMAYETARIMRAIVQGEELDLPEDGVVHIPTRTINKDNVEEFGKKLNELRGAEEQRAEP